jgi:myo-inositol-1(or 4)-monophosphatase
MECAIDAARTAGEYALRNNDRRRETVKIFQHDVKLKLDIECQEQAENVIRKTYPDHDILGEESTTHADSPPDGIQWIIDPIDGTVNFTHGLPIWCCSVAARLQDKVLAGAVYAPVLKELYSASADTPSTLNGRHIQVSGISDLAHAIVHTGIDRDPDRTGKPMAVFEKLAFKAQKARIMGSAAYDMCQVAAGHSEGYYETSIFLWDVAAAGLIVQQAGGNIEILARLKGAHHMAFMATNGRIHKQLKNLIRS